MKKFYDDEFVGFGVLLFDVPVDYGEDICNKLKAQGYKRICLPHISAVGKSRSQLKMSWEMPIQACCRTLAKELIKNSNSLPTLLFVIDTFDGHLIIRPFRLVAGKTYETNARDSSNKQIFVDLVEETPIHVP